MAIAPWCTFGYRVKPRKAGQSWVGRAASSRDASLPGAAGAWPRFQLYKGSVSLQPAESDLEQWASGRFQEGRGLPQRVSFQVGDALALCLQQGDTLLLNRGEGGDFGIALLREEKLVLALGAVFNVSLGAEVKLADDPRKQDSLWYEIATELQRPNTKLVWIDSREGDLASWKMALKGCPVGQHLIVAVRTEGHDLVDEIWKIVPREGPRSTTVTRVNPSFADEKAWRAALSLLAGGPPKDPYVSVCIRGNEIHLREGQKVIFES